jgi:hypothetical protein
MHRSIMLYNKTESLKDRNSLDFNKMIIIIFVFVQFYTLDQEE